MARVLDNDLTIIYYSANVVPNHFADKFWIQLEKAAQGLNIIPVTQKPLPIENNIVVDLPRHHLSIYRQALLGAEIATTKYIAMAEDDVLYSPEHFKQRPEVKPFAYNMGYWNITTWGEPLFTHKGGSRINLGNLICEREAFIYAMTERFDKYPDGKVNLGLWAELGKYERQLGVTVQEYETFYTNPPNIMFSHETSLSYEGLGTRKRLGEFRANNIPYWGEAKTIRSYYGK